VVVSVIGGNGPLRLVFGAREGAGMWWWLDKKGNTPLTRVSSEGGAVRGVHSARKTPLSRVSSEGGVSGGGVVVVVVKIMVLKRVKYLVSEIKKK
jgi:hypothetical protein